MKIYHNLNRYYDPDAGRYVSVDPLIEMTGGASLKAFAYQPQFNSPYGYVGNNPVMFVDAQGLYWEYSQTTRQLVHVDNHTRERTILTSGYSGHGAGLNNPAKQNVSDIGPIPQGNWRLAFPYDSDRTGPYTIPLIPQEGTDIFGRKDFRIHGDTDCRCQNASTGCIVISPRSFREQIWNSNDRDLRVIR